MLVNGVLHHVKDLWPVVRLKPSSDEESDSEDSARLVYLKSDPLRVASDISTLPADANMASCSDVNGSSMDESSSKDKAHHPAQKECLTHQGAQDESENLPPQSFVILRSEGHVMSRSVNLTPPKWVKGGAGVETMIGSWFFYVNAWYFT